MKIVEKGNFTPVFLNAVSVVILVVFVVLMCCDLSVCVGRIVSAVLIVACGVVGLGRKSLTYNRSMFGDGCHIEFKINRKK